MFTGIIEGLGTITGIRPFNQGRQLTLNANFSLSDSKIGDSIAVNGACLTATKIINDCRFEVDVSPETISTTTIGFAKVGERVNLERALRLSDRIDGHLVSGHVDGIGTIISQTPQGNAVIITIEVHSSLSRYMIKKGSVAVDGTSLTINQCGDTSFSVSIIPHTAEMTTLLLKKVREKVNIETDMIGKYVERFVQPTDKKDTDFSNPIDREFLAKTGFLP
ncbi:MAG: riboflavin synthase [Desulfobacteraceae bacterium]|jgi:riboflavin synthase